MVFLPSDLTPHASAQHFFGAELRHYRMRAGLSQLQLAPLVFTAPSMLGKVEMAQRYPTLNLAERCDDVLRCDGALIRLFDLVSSERATALARSAESSSGPAELLVRLLESVAGIVASTGAQASPVAGASAVLDSIDAVLTATMSSATVRAVRNNDRG